jgi:hypothetical protein
MLSPSKKQLGDTREPWKTTSILKTPDGLSIAIVTSEQLSEPTEQRVTESCSNACPVLGADRTTQENSKTNLLNGLFQAKKETNQIISPSTHLRQFPLALATHLLAEGLQRRQHPLTQAALKAAWKHAQHFC